MSRKEDRLATLEIVIAARGIYFVLRLGGGKVSRGESWQQSGVPFADETKNRATTVC